MTKRPMPDIMIPTVKRMLERGGANSEIMLEGRRTILSEIDRRISNSLRPTLKAVGVDWSTLSADERKEYRAVWRLAKQRRKNEARKRREARSNEVRRTEDDDDDDDETEEKLCPISPRAGSYCRIPGFHRHPAPEVEHLGLRAEIMRL